jgi:type VI secretion system secreted protein Hcp
VNNENLTRCELKCFTPGRTATATGVEVNHFNIILTNATIAGIKEAMLNNSMPDNVSLPLMEEVSFTYQKIEWVWTDGNITATDDWEAII